MTWLAFTALGICIALLIRSALRAVVEHALEDGRWDDDWRVVVTGDASIEQDFDLPCCEPHCVPSRRPTNGAPNTGRGTIGLQVGE